MKITSIFLFFILFLISCSLHENEDLKTEARFKNENVLLANKVFIKNLVEIENKINPDWTIGFDRYVFVKNIFLKIFSGEYPHIYSTDMFKEEGKYTIEDVKDRMLNLYIYSDINNQKDTIIFSKEKAFNQVTEIFFEEEWSFNSETYEFKKDIFAWCPVKTYFKPGDYKADDLRHRKITWIKNEGDPEAKTKIAEDIKYVFLADKGVQSYVFSRQGLDFRAFLRFIVESIENEKIKAYDPIYLVDKTKRPFTIKQLENYAGFTIGDENIFDEIYKLIFVEDWYFNYETFYFEKRVKGIGFVAERLQNEEWNDKMLFFIFLN